MRAQSNVNCLGCRHDIELRGTYDPDGTQGIVLDDENAANVSAQGAFNTYVGRIIEGSAIVKCPKCGLQNLVTLLFNNYE